MSFNIDKGLFTSDFIDHHAVLGVPVDADMKGIRKQYLKIARRLHPDSSDIKTDSDRRLAGEYLSKLVNPAYEYLSQEKNFSEHQIILKLKGQQAQRQQETIVLSTDRARQLAAASNTNGDYQAALKELVEQQYQALEQTPEVIGRISELNLVYLMRTAGQDNGALRTAARPDEQSSLSSTPAAKPASRPAAPPPTKDSLVDSFIRRAEEFEKQQNYAKAILELREALKLNPKNSNCHSRMGMIYIKTKQAKMARIHFDKALEINPNDEIAGAGRRMLEQSGNASQATGAKSTGSKRAASDKDTSSKGGLFGLFGGRKK
ncbi:MAG: tetratricopeptide repeat protein [Leptolyngbya sp. DLM2.Bin15]|nr:MAG: tetratricopeptide repeat protein [Leptolyngbya sp. DLM2.Bin15]